MHMLDDLFAQLEVVVQNLIDTIGEETELHRHEWDAKVRGWMNSQDDRLEARKWNSDIQALAPSLDRINIRGKVRQLEERRDLLTLRIKAVIHSA